MKNTRAHVKKNPTIRLETNLPPKGRQNQAMKGAQNQKGNHCQEKFLRIKNTQHIVEERGSSGRDARSHHGLSDDDFFDTPQVLYQERIVQQDISNLDARNLDKYFQYGKSPPMSDSSLKGARPRNLEPESFSDDKTSSSNFTIHDLDEIETLRRQLAEQEAIDRRLQKEREENIVKALEEKQTLLKGQLH